MVRLSGLPAAALHRMCTELLGTQLLPFLYDLRHLTSKHVRKREVKVRSVEYCGSANGLRIFSRRKVAAIHRRNLNK